MRSLRCFKPTDSEQPPQGWYREAVAVGAGGVFCLLLWVLLVPWDLSELDIDGQIIVGGGNDTGTAIFVVLIALFVIGLGAVLLSPRVGRIAAIASFTTWAGLYVWRAAVSRVIGANMWPVGFLYFVLPAVSVASVLVILVEARVAKWRANQNQVVR